MDRRHEDHPSFARPRAPKLMSIWPRSALISACYPSSTSNGGQSQDDGSGQRCVPMPSSYRSPPPADGRRTTKEPREAASCSTQSRERYRAKLCGRAFHRRGLALLANGPVSQPSSGCLEGNRSNRRIRPAGPRPQTARSPEASPKRRASRPGSQVGDERGRWLTTTQPGVYCALTTRDKRT